MSPTSLRDDYARAWYAAAERGEMRLTWRGRHLLKCPMDLLVYAEIIHRVRPMTIVETGTYVGASAMFLSDIQRMVEPRGVVITIDPCPGTLVFPEYGGHIVRVVGSSVSDCTLWTVQDRIEQCSGAVMVVLDSDHHADHVYAELCAYAPLVTPGSYLIVEDTTIHGHPVHVSSPSAADEDPTAGLARWLAEQPAGTWEQDRTCERFWLTWNPGGYVKRLR